MIAKGHVYEKVPCPECGRLFGKSGMGRHLQAHRHAELMPVATGPKPDKVPYDKHAIVTCDVCGREVKASGLGNHRAAHKRQLGVVAVPLPKVTNHASVDAVRELTGIPNMLDGITTMEVALAVLSRLSNSGTIKIIDLPEVIAWVAATDQIVRLVTA